MTMTTKERKELFKERNADVQLLSASAVADDVRDFFESIYHSQLSERKAAYLMLSTDEELCNVRCTSIDELLSYYATYHDKFYNFYFSVNKFSGWRTNAKCVETNAIFIDIDGLEHDFTLMSQADIEMYLIDTYHVPRSLLPTFLITSGHGLHLYYIIDTIDFTRKKTRAEREALRLKYTKALIYYFKADLVCKNSSRILRVPNSLNVKNSFDIKRTKLFKLNHSDDFAISRLDYFLCSEEEYAAYAKSCNAAAAEKRRATMQKNSTAPGRKKKLTSDTAQKVSFSEVQEEELHKVLKEEKKVTSRRVIKDIFFNLDAKSRTKRLLYDLRQYAQTHCVVQGQRHTYCFISSILLKRLCLSEEDAVAYLSHIVRDEDFSAELAETVSQVYKKKAFSKESYMISNAFIAETLSYTDTDMQDMCSCYYKDRTLARKESQRMYRQKQKAASDAEKAKLYAYRKAFIEEKSELGWSKKKIAEHLEISTQTVTSIMKKEA